ncbi:MAG: DNA polymerase III, partial [Lachnospiraceae bacterium]|nr:DNA polymerase III [Lachnospiraceae bacterium]
MNYIVFDLEWNQCPYGKNREVRELPFEIIEIGAVKLDADRNYVDSYE